MKIELNHVTKMISRRLVIDDISLKLEGGKIWGFKGINGSGKTMLMRVISGLIKPDSGSVIIDSKVLWKDISFPESIGILIEAPAFLDGLTGFQNLKVLASIKNKISDDQIKQAISDVGLNPNLSKKYKAYSLGMKQRLGIAAALMEKPDIILLDEPTNALDDKGVKLIYDIIREERERGAFVLISTHHKEDLKETCDIILLSLRRKENHNVR